MMSHSEIGSIYISDCHGNERAFLALFDGFLLRAFRQFVFSPIRIQIGLWNEGLE